jgi:HAD superfamily hydrolase (TIGR01459 family)
MIPIYERLGSLLSEYNTLICDVWGVLHDGIQAFPAANEALLTFREQGGTVILLSNSPGRSASVERVLAHKGVQRGGWDALITSGDLTHAEIKRRALRHIYHIGTPRDLHLFEDLHVDHVPIEEAQAIVVTGLFDDENETAHTYLPSLTTALKRGLPLICANPDLIVHVGHALLPCAGAIADLYEKLGGNVYWAGKPHRPAYDTAFACATKIRGTPASELKIIAIGDAIRTDIAGAHGMGLPAVLISKGIHRDELHPAHNGSAEIHAATLEKIAAPYTRTLRGAAPALAW